MRSKFLLVCVVVFGIISHSFAGDYKIGVLAKNGPVKALNQWGATADYLTLKISGHSFTIVPLDFDEVFGDSQNN